MDLPDWAAWSWREEFLPAPFHTVRGLLEAQALLHQQPKTLENANHIVLGIGLALCYALTTSLGIRPCE